MIKKPKESPSYLQHVKEIVNAFAGEMKSELDLDCCGSGGSMPHDVEEIEVMFSVQRRATLEEARELEVKAVGKLIKMINAHEKIRPYLREFPFTLERVGVSIVFDNEYNQNYADGTIAFISSIRGKLYYRTMHPITGEFIHILNEPFEEAQKIVQNHPLNHDVRFHQDKPYESHVDQIFKSFAKEAKSKWGLDHLHQGGKIADGIEELAMSFATTRKTPLEKARKLEVEMTDRFLEIINSNEKIRPYLKEYPVKPNRAKIAITFRKAPYDYYTDGSVAAVRQEDNKIFYSIMPPDRGFVRPLPFSEETYEEAKRMVRGN